MLVAVRRLAALNGGLLRGTSNHVSLCCGAVFCCSSLASRDHFSLEHGRICVSLEHGRTCIEFTAGEKRKCTGEGRENMPHGLCRCRTWTEGGRMGDAAPPFRPPTPDSQSPLHHVSLASRERIGAAVLSYVGETGFCGISAAHGSVYSRHGTEYSA